MYLTKVMGHPLTSMQTQLHKKNRHAISGGHGCLKAFPWIPDVGDERKGRGEGTIMKKCNNKNSIMIK